MKPATQRNFLIGGVLLAALLGVEVYSQLRQEPTCGPDSDAMVTLIDFTDVIGGDAIARLKDTVWDSIEKSSAGTNVVLRPILGSDRAGGKRIVVPDKVLCRPSAPSTADGVFGSIRKPQERWRQFKDQVCGDSPAGTDPWDVTLKCSDPRRGKSFFEQEYPVSHSSPIVEEITDAVRRYLPSEVEHWHLIIASDWREYNPPVLDLEYHKCDLAADPRRVAQIPLIGQAEKLLRGSAGQLNNEVDGFLVLRSDMTSSEAECLSQVEDEFFRESVASPPPTLRFERLPVTQK